MGNAPIGIAVRAQDFMTESDQEQTLVILLRNLRHQAGPEQAPPEQPAPGIWEQFVDRYSPLLHYWARRLGLQIQDAADLVQDVFMLLVQKLPRFDYQPGRSFRGWMRAILMNRWRDQRQRVAAIPLDSIELAAPPDAETLEEREFRYYVVGRALRLMEADFDPTTCQACWETVVCSRSGADVAAELGLSVDAVYMAKSRVLNRLREDLKDLAA